MTKAFVAIIIAIILVASLVVGTIIFVAGTVVTVGACAITAPLTLYTQIVTSVLPPPPTIAGGIPYLNQFKGTDLSSREAIAELIISIGKQRGFSSYSIAIAIATAIQESGLQNDNYGDLDSLGVYQQRPSAGWGTASQILNPSYAINKFYDRLQTIPDRDSRPMISVAEQVQIPNLADYARGWAQKDLNTVAPAIVAKLGGGTVSQSIAQSAPTNSGANASFLTACLSKVKVKTSGMTSNSGSSTPGGWTSPLAPGYTETDPFGERISPVTHRPQFHTGLDLADPIGTPIHAVHDGTVITAAPDGTYGNWILLDEGGNIESGYAHLSRYADGIVPGTHVTEGEIIGYVGMTGDATGPHLHFEVRVNKSPVDPKAFMKQQGVTIE